MSVVLWVGLALGPGMVVGSAYASVPAGTIDLYAGNGSYGYSGDGGPAVSAEFNNPWGNVVAIDPAGNVLIADTSNHVLRKVDRSTGVITTIAGDGSYGCSGDGGLATSAELGYPESVAVDSAGDIFVGDTGCLTVRKIEASTGEITTVAGNGSWGQSGDSGPATSAELSGPFGLALDSSGNLFIADQNSSYGARVRKVSATTGDISTVAGTFSSTCSYSDGVLATTACIGSSGIALDSAGDIFVEGGCSSGDCVREVDHSTGDIKTVAGGAPWYAPGGDGGPALNAAFQDVQALAIDAQGNLYIADDGGSTHCVVRKLNAVTGIITTVAGNWRCPYPDTGIGGPAIDAGFNFLSALAVDADGNVFLFDNDMNQLYEVHRIGGIAPTGGAVTTTEAPSGTNPSEPNCACAQAVSDDPVNTANGNFSQTFTNLSIPGRGPSLALQQTYNSASAATTGPLGYGWSFNYRMSLSASSSTATITQEDGSEVGFSLSGGGWAPAAPRVDATLVHNSDGSWTFTRQGTQIFTFNSSGQLTSKSDLNGYTTTLSYLSGNLSTVTDPAGRTLSFSYSAGKIASVTDSASRSVSFTYSGSGELSSLTDPTGAVTSFTYNSSHRLLTILDPNQATAGTPHPLTLTYNTDGTVATKTDPLGHETSYDYSSIPNATKVTDPNANVMLDYYQDGELIAETKAYGTSKQATWSYEYDPETLGMIAQTDPNGHVSSSTYDPSGNVLTKSDGNHDSWTYTYNSINEPLTATDPNGVETTYTYDSNGNKTSVSTPLVGSSPAVSATATYAYGDLSHPGDVTEMTDPNGKSWAYAYNADGDRTSVTDPLSHETTYTYDGIGDKLTIVSARGNVSGATPSDYTTTYTYDLDGRSLTTTDPNSHVTTYAYDGDGNKTSVEDGNSNTTSYVYDLTNELVTTTLPTTDTLTYTYDGNGNKLSETNAAAKTTSYTYDALNYLASMTDPNSHTTSYTYDAVGNLLTLTDPDSNVTTHIYDSADQLTEIDYSDGVTPSDYYGYDAAGHRTSMSDTTGSSSWTWDSLGRMTSYTNGNSQIVSYTHDLVGHVTGITYPDTNAVTRTYNDAGQLSSVEDWNSHTTSFGYDANGNLTFETYANGISVALNYDHADQLAGITDTLSASTIASFDYGRDGNNQITSETDTGVPSPMAGSYGYTNLNQLASDGAGSYSYDAANNLTALPDGTVQHFDPANQLCWTASTTGSSCATAPSGATTYSYSNEGNRSAITPPSATATSYSWNQANELGSLSGAASASYTYDGDGLRQSKTISSTTTNSSWDESGPIPLLLMDGSTDYIYGPNNVPIEQIDGSSTRYYQQDQLGSTRLVTDNTGSILASYTYTPYGKIAATTGTSTILNGNPIQYAGQYTDPETGLVYLRARYYDPATGQFLSIDPALRVTASAYAYAGDDPVNSVDPSGESTWFPIVSPCALALFLCTSDHTKKTFARGCWNALNPINGLPSIILDIIHGSYEHGAIFKKGAKIAVKDASKDWIKDLPYVSPFTCAGGGITALLGG